MSELSKAQRLTQDLRSLRKMSERLDELCANWIDWDYGNMEELSQLKSEVDETISSFELRLSEEKELAKE